MSTARAPRPYSFVRHLANAIWLHHDPCRCHLAVFTAYFDASGHPDDRSVTDKKLPSFFLSGFIASEQKWLRFESAWRQLLSEFGMTPPFHMTDFEAGEGAYAGWKNKQERKQEFLNRAVEVMHKHTNKAFSVGLVLPDFRRMLVEYDVPKSVPRKPFPWCGMHVCEAVLGWAATREKKGKLRPGEQLAFVFEDGDKHRGQLSDAIKAKTGEHPVFRSKQACLPFDACDLLAWEHRTYLGHHAASSRYAPRPSVVAIDTQLVNSEFRLLDWENLKHYCEFWKFPKRENAPTG